MNNKWIRIQHKPPHMVFYLILHIDTVFLYLKEFRFFRVIAHV